MEFQLIFGLFFLMGLVRGQMEILIDDLAPAPDVKPVTSLEVLGEDDRFPYHRQGLFKGLKEEPGSAKSYYDGPSLDKVLRLLLSRIATTDRSQEAPKDKIEGSSRTSISEICGQSATLNCGKIALRKIQDGFNALHAKCDARKEFMYCVEDSRSECKSKILKEDKYPQLPSPENIAAFQRLVKNSLWTGGGCILAY